ncbi:MAG: hypothetical protein ACM3XS_09530 [Bacteroidota bacterium]
MAETKKEFDPGEIDLHKDLDELILGAGAYRNMVPYFALLAEHFDRSPAQLRSRYSYLRRKQREEAPEPARRGRPRKNGGAEELIQIFAEVFRIKPSREAAAILRECAARHGALRVAMAMERVRPEGGEVFARAIAAELGEKKR